MRVPGPTGRDDDEVVVRFDDCSGPSPVGFRLAGPLGSIEARTAEEVRPALAAVESAVRDGAWAGGFLSYEAAPGLDPRLEVRPPGPEAPPLLWFGLFERREEAPPLGEPDRDEAAPSPSWHPSVGAGAHARAVDWIRRLIAAGETYQVNLTFRLRAAFDGDERALYRALCLAQRAAHCAYVSTGRFRVLSASPELFFRIEGDRLWSRPMKGTARRGGTAEEDEARRLALARSPKERAENAMIVDLIRNDLGRVALPGTVEVPSLFETERYETVWQLTSTVECRIGGDAPVGDVLAALYPCGSVTGAPKVATMRAIAAIEESPRGIYTGAVGFLAPPGGAGPRASFNVAIRTVVVDAHRGTAEFGVGGGITWDSAAGAEYDECRAKALVLSHRRPSFELLETMRLEPSGSFRRRERHLRRLAASAAYFGFRFDPARAAAALDRLAGEGGAPRRVRLLLGRDGTLRAETSPIAEESAEPVRLALDPEPVEAGDPFLFHKTTRREVYERRAARHPEADQVVLVNERGEITETTVANLAVRLRGRWWTPPITAGCLPGVERGALVAAGELAERSLQAEDLRRAEAVAVVSSLRGWRPAALVEVRDLQLGLLDR